MKIYKTTLQLSLMAVALTGFGTANAAQVQYDFLTNVSIVGSNISGEVNVNNATLSFVVDWIDIVGTGSTTTAEGNILSIFASIPANSTGFDSALLNDDTTSSLSPFFSTVGFDTTELSDAESSLSTLAGGPTGIFPNGITATDPFGLNPIFGGGFVDADASGFDLTGFIFDRSYSFGLDSDGTGGVYQFVEQVMNTSISPSGDIVSESVSISYEVGQYLGSGAVVPVPAAAPLGLLGLGIVGWLGRRKREPVAVDKE